MPHRFPALIAAPRPGEGRLWLTGVRLFAGVDGLVRDGTAVLVEDGVIRRVGSASEGKLADLLIVEGDPLTEPELLADPQSIWLVLQLGVPVAGRALEQDVGVA